MEIEVKSDAQEFTDSPRQMTKLEMDRVREMDRISAIKFHRMWTGSTLRAAIREVDTARAINLLG